MNGNSHNSPKISVVIGSQWGDEGKGKLVDLLAQKADVVARCQGGNNAGHTVVTEEGKFAFHLLPSGLINPQVKAVLGNGVVINVPEFLKEIEENEAKGQLISELIFDVLNFSKHQCKNLINFCPRNFLNWKKSN